MFKEAFKYYKRKKPLPDLTNVINFSLNDCNENIEVVFIEDPLVNSRSYGLIPPKEWQIINFKNKEGLIFIKNPFTTLGQRYWIARCLKDFSRKPNKLNIDAHNYLSEKEEWWEVCNTDENRATLTQKLRWATLGYHHDWNTKVYKETSKGIFPEDLASLCQYVANIVGFTDFNAEAAIINFYHMDSTLAGHTDHSEDNLEAPLFSFSFGQSAIFLIGGKTEDCPVIPFFIHSGDIVIMSKESRLCYHAVPKISDAPTQIWNPKQDNQIDRELNRNDKNYPDVLKEYCKGDIFWKPFDNYVQKSRININVRQVLKNGESKLC